MIAKILVSALCLIAPITGQLILSLNNKTGIQTYVVGDSFDVYAQLVQVAPPSISYRQVFALAIKENNNSKSYNLKSISSPYTFIFGQNAAANSTAFLANVKLPDSFNSSMLYYYNGSDACHSYNLTFQYTVVNGSWPNDYTSFDGYDSRIIRICNSTEAKTIAEGANNVTPTPSPAPSTPGSGASKLSSVMMLIGTFIVYLIL